MSRMTSTPPLASAASLAPQQNFQQPSQGNSHQPGHAYQQPSQGTYQQQGQDVYSQTNQGGTQQPHHGAFQQPQQVMYQQPQQGGYQQPNQAMFPQSGQSHPFRQVPSQQNLGPRTPNTSAEDPFAHLPYPVSFCLRWALAKGKLDAVKLEAVQQVSCKDITTVKLL